MEVTDLRNTSLRKHVGLNTHRALMHLLVSTVGFTLVSTPVRAHDGVGHGGTPIAFATVVGLPVIAGLLGGVSVVLYRSQVVAKTTHHRASAVVGLLLIVLGSTFVITAITKNFSLGLAGGSLGALGTLWLTNHDREGQQRHGRHTDLALGGVCAHRLLEGMIIGTIYTAGAAVGLVGLIVIASHTALETAAVGGLYAPRQLRTLGAVILVQVGYVAGVIVSINVARSAPVWMQIVLHGLMAGVFLVMGIDEARHSTIAIRSQGVPK